MSGDDRQQELELPPRASALVESLRDMGYSLPTALADVIDNSITAGARNVRLFAETHDVSPAIGVLDDGIGMSKEDLLEAMRPGTKSPLDTRSESDLGRFGLGLKTASFSQCRRLTVVTRKDAVVSCAIWDLDKVAKRDKWVVEIPDSIDGVRWSEHLDTDGTLVVWEKLDRLIRMDAPQDGSDLVRQLDEAASHVEFVFHRFLSGREDRHVSISLNDRALEPFDPFYWTHPATQHHQEMNIPLKGETIKVWPVTLPHHDKITQDEWDKYGRDEGYVRNQGFYLYRNRRLIVHGTWFRLVRQLELTKLSRVGIDIPNTMDAEWKIDVRKASAQPPAPVRKELQNIIERLGIPSRLTYTGRGARLTEANRIPVWVRIQNRNRILYEVSEEHPVLTTFKDNLDLRQANEFDRILRLLASTFPLEALHIDVSANPESAKQPQIESRDLYVIVSGMLKFLRSQGHSLDDIKERMRTADPFRTQWAETSEMITDICRNDEDP